MQKLSQPNLDGHSRANLPGVLQYSTILTEGYLHTFCNIRAPNGLQSLSKDLFPTRLHPPPPPGEGGIDSLGIRPDNQSSDIK